MPGKDDTPKKDIFVPSVPLLNEHTEEVISKVMSDLESEYGLLGAPPTSESVHFSEETPDELGAELGADLDDDALDGPHTEEVIADVMADLDEGLQQLRDIPKATPTPPAVTHRAPDALESALRRGGLHRYLSWLIDVPRYLDEDALDHLLDNIPADPTIDRARADALAARFPSNRALGQLLALAAEASAPLADIALHALTQPTPHRALLHGPIGDPMEDVSWLSDAAPPLPRPLVLLDLRPGIPLTPEHLGFTSGQAHRPDANQNPAPAINNAITNYGSLRWMDLSTPIGNDRTLTLHLRGDLNGSELSRLFYRGDNGLRIVGTLHAGLTINVLALYEP